MDKMELELAELNRAVKKCVDSDRNAGTPHAADRLEGGLVDSSNVHRTLYKSLTHT